MKLLWIFRAMFVIVVVAVLFVNISSTRMTLDESGEPSNEVFDTNLLTVSWSGFGMLVFVLLLDVFTPKKKLSALAGVFFGLLVGMLFSWVLAPVVEMIIVTFGISVTQMAITAIKWTMGICICYYLQRFINKEHNIIIHNI